jgi:hypothetical protein
MQVVDISDAERAYLERVADDCRQILGVGIEVQALELAANDEIVLRVAYRLGATGLTSEGRGESVVAAHVALRHQLVVDRIRLGATVLWS